MNRAALFALALVAAAPAVGGEIANNQNPIAAIPLSSLSATRERPVFSPTRRPPAPPPRSTVALAPPLQTVATPAPAAPTFQLVGTVLGPNGKIAIVTEGGDPPLRLREGEAAEGWTLREVAPRAATLEGYGRVVTLDLRTDGADPNGVAAAPKAPPSND